MTVGQLNPMFQRRQELKWRQKVPAAIEVGAKSKERAIATRSAERRIVDSAPDFETLRRRLFKRVKTPQRAIFLSNIGRYHIARWGRASLSWRFERSAIVLVENTTCRSCNKA